jgi:glycine/D-amino acid oxidase-like deaminating enzyme
MRLLIIGGSDTGISAALRLQEADGSADVSVLLAARARARAIARGAFRLPSIFEIIEAEGSQPGLILSLRRTPGT